MRPEGSCTLARDPPPPPTPAPRVATRDPTPALLALGPRAFEGVDDEDAAVPFLGPAVDGLEAVGLVVAAATDDDEATADRAVDDADEAAGRVDGPPIPPAVLPTERDETPRRDIFVQIGRAHV